MTGPTDPQTGDRHVAYVAWSDSPAERDRLAGQVAVRRHVLLRPDRQPDDAVSRV